MVQMRIACKYPWKSKVRSSLRNLTRLIEARLQAVSSRNIYSEQGLEALMRPDSGQVCHSLMVVSNCTPGSAHDHAANAICSHRSRARRVLCTLPSVRRINGHSPSVSAASMNALGIRTELLEFCP